MAKQKKNKEPKGDSRFKSIPNPLKRRGKTEEEKISDALSTVPRITNETVADHREEVLSGARKHIYPLQQSKHHVVRISLSIVAIVLLSFMVFTSLALYKFQMTNSFIYDVTRIIPFPVAKAGDSWVSYESYLFELRHNMHYYKTQQQANFSTKDGQEQLKRLKVQALDQVVRDAYVKQLASQNKVTVGNQAVNDQIAMLKNQNRLGTTDHVFKEVLGEFWGWNVADFKRELKQQLLQQAVVAKLDGKTNAKAQAALKQLIGGTDFATLANQITEDPATKGNGGQYPNAITAGSRDMHPNITNEVFKLKAMQVSNVVNAGNSLEIIKVIDTNGNTAHAAHIQFNLQPVTVFVKPVQTKAPVHAYIKVQ